MAETHEAILDELRDGVADIDGVDLSLPAYMETNIAASNRALLRNTAVLAQMNQRIARKIQNTKEAEAFGKQLSTLIRQIAELDALYPKAKKRMAELDEQGRPQEG